VLVNKPTKQNKTGKNNDFILIFLLLKEDTHCGVSIAGELHPIGYNSQACVSKFLIIVVFK
jgi:hypothetical protein